MSRADRDAERAYQHSYYTEVVRPKLQREGQRRLRKLAQVRAWRAAHPEQVHANRKRWKEEHRESALASKRAWARRYRTRQRAKRAERAYQHHYYVTVTLPRRQRQQQQ